jgi:predicted ATPase
MRMTHLKLSNWRNFKTVDVDVPTRLFVLGPNASGKSNLLDAVRFLRDLTVDGGGFQQAVKDRGGLSRVRNLAARTYNGGRVTVAVTLGDDVDPAEWEYELTFTGETAGRRRPLVHSETIKNAGAVVLSRPTEEDAGDRERLTQTALEQVIANRDFRPVAEFFASVRYLHLVPQVIRDPDRGRDRIEDPFGADFLSRVARTGARERGRRLHMINEALRLAVPQLESLELVPDVDGQPHLEARYKHWRRQGARQNEADFSDGTLRLIGLLWALQERSRKGTSGPILLEEPELSLHPEIVRQLPTLLAKASRSTGRQVIATTHADDLLDDEGLGLDEVLVLNPSHEGTTAVKASDIDEVRDDVGGGGLTLLEALQPRLVPESIDELSTLKLV